MAALVFQGPDHNNFVMVGPTAGGAYRVLRHVDNDPAYNSFSSVQFLDDRTLLTDRWIVRVSDGRVLAEAPDVSYR
jgi:hypothetical protein